MIFFLGNSNFFWNLTGSDVYVTLAIQNNANAPMKIQSNGAKGAVLLTVPAGQTVTAVFHLVQGNSSLYSKEGGGLYIPIPKSLLRLTLRIMPLNWISRIMASARARYRC
jgi:hypothetical protein